MAMTLRLTEEQDAQLGAVAESMNISKQRAVEIALDEYLAKHDQERVMSEVINKVLSRDAELMRRLADS
jgi:predicted transcriptional regulator